MSPSGRTATTPRRAALAIGLFAMAALSTFAGAGSAEAGSGTEDASTPAPTADLLPKKAARIIARDALLSGKSDSEAQAIAAAAITTPRPTAATATDDPIAAARKAWEAELKRRIGKPPPALINFYNTWTHEYVVVDATKGTLAAEQVNQLLRCHFTNEPAAMDARLIPSVLRAARSFRSSRVDIVSGFRAPKYNLMLRKKGRAVARDSQHTYGHAIDFRLRGVGLQALHHWAVGLGLGGVGVYRDNEFVHLDTGRVRYWNGE